MTKRHARVFYGWWVVVAAAVGLFWGPPVTIFAFSVFLKPLMQDFHAGRAEVSLAFTLHNVVAALATPLAGWLIARYGARKVILPGTVIFGAILLFNKAFTGTLWHFYFFYAALGLLIQAVGPVPYGCVVSRWFDRRRGLALGLMMVGIGLGAMVLPSLAHTLIAHFGWHTTYAIIGSLVLLISIPVVGLTLKEKPQDLGLLPDGGRSVLGAANVTADLLGIGRQDALRDRLFWLMLCAFCMVSLSVQGCLVHIAALLTDRGMNPQAAAFGASIMGAAVLAGRVGTGYLLDRFVAWRVVAIIFGGAAAGIGGLMIHSTPAIALLDAFLIGLGLGAEVDIIAYLVSRYFGLRSFAEIYSYLFGAFALAGAFGPLLMGAGFDMTGSYNAPLAVLFVLTLVATALVTRLGPYRYPVQQDESNATPLSVETPA